MAESKRKGTLRKIVGRYKIVNTYTRPGEGSVNLELECGHIIRRKLSQEPLFDAYCTECTDLRRDWKGASFD
jgi:hypothetical protein